MDRKSFVDLVPAERDAFLQAVLTLKNTPANPADPPDQQYSVYDQFVAIHGAVMSIEVAGFAELANFGHRNIGFLPWHREYIRRFELKLQEAVPGVMLPYWDWTKHREAMDTLFQDDFRGQVHPGDSQVQPLTSGYFAYNAPPLPLRPTWWPAGLPGWRIPVPFQELRYPPEAPNAAELNATLHRGDLSGDPVPPLWPATASLINQITNLHISDPNIHHYYFFSSIVESGVLSASSGVLSTHDMGHLWIGGHMSGAFSPNDPIFWMHHAYIDRLWAVWQKNGHQGPDHYPDDTQDPMGNPIPPGHKRGDVMWPWVGTSTDYRAAGVEAEVIRMLPDYSHEAARHVIDVMDTTNLGPLGGYDYA